MNKILSVSVAAYKVEKYIEKTLNSCVVPEIMDKLEVIVILDGVCDNTPELAKQFEARYPDTFRVIKKENGGYGTTVNRGVEEATGKYFKLLDGDDTFDKAALIRLVNELERTDADWVISAKKLIQEKDGLSKISYPVSDELVKKIDGKTLAARKVKFDAYCSMWNNTVKTSILKSHLPRLPGNCQYTDELYNVSFLPHVKTIKFVLSPVYEYLLRDREFDEETKRKNLENFIFIRKKEIKFFGNTPKADNHRLFKYRVKTYYQRLIMAILGMKPSKEMLKTLINTERYCKKHAPELYEEALIGAKKIKLLRMFRYNYLIYYTLGLTVRDYITIDKTTIN